MMISEQNENFIPNTDRSNSNLREPLDHFVNLTNAKIIACKSEKLDLSFEVHVENEAMLSHQKCFIMTIHDLGSNHTQFERFIHSEQMTGIRNRVIWLNINLPGQELDADDLSIRKYPTMEELAEELVCVIDYLKIPQVVCMGEGAGANISAYFAMKHPSRCLGVVLLEPIASSASIMESIKYKLNNFNFVNRTKLGNMEKPNFIFNRLDTTSGSEIEALNIEMDDANRKVFENHNSKNLALFAQAFLNRSNLGDELGKLKVDALIAVGKNSPMFNETKRIYRTLQELNKKTPQRMVNSPYLELENVTSVLKECPDRLATSLQFFLQGIGLLSAMPMNKSFRSLSIVSAQSSGYERSHSLDDNEPKVSSSSQSETGSDHDHDHVSSNQSLNCE